MRYLVLMATLHLARATLNGARSMGIRSIHSVAYFRARQTRWRKEILPFSSFSLSASKHLLELVALRRIPLFVAMISCFVWLCRSFTIPVA